jgi:hypothetical protein
MENQKVSVYLPYHSISENQGITGLTARKNSKIYGAGQGKNGNQYNVLPPHSKKSGALTNPLLAGENEENQDQESSNKEGNCCCVMC